MKKNRLKSLLSLLLCLALLAAAALSVTASAEETTAAVDTAIPLTGTREAPYVIGEGTAHTFAFCVLDLEGNSYWFEVHTDKDNLGEALQELLLVDGKVSEYGLFVEEVCGIRLSYDDGGHWWEFFVSSPVGVDSTPIQDYTDYLFVAR